MNAVFENNLELVGERHPWLVDEVRQAELPADRRVVLNQRQVQVFQSLNLRGQWINLTSAHDPVAEGQRQAGIGGVASAKIVFVLGLAGFYHVEAALQRARADAIVVALDNHVQNVRLVMESRDIRAALADERLLLGIYDDVRVIKEHILALVHSDMFTVPTFECVFHPVEEQLNPDLFMMVRQHLHRMYSTALVNYNTTRAFEHDWSRNLLCNVPYAISGIPVTMMQDSLRGLPVIVVGAGPSLNKNMELLHEAKGKAFIICVDTAFRALSKRGIVPDLIVTLDGSPLNAEHLRACHYSGIPLLMDVYSHSDIAHHHEGPKIIIAAVSHHSEWWKQTLAEDPVSVRLVQGGSVATAGFSFARFLGADPIIMIGVDLSYPNGLAYAAGSLHDQRTIKDIEANRELFRVTDLDGNDVYTTFDYLFYLRWFESVAKDVSDVTLINATEGGALREGFQIRTLRDTLDEFCRTPNSFAIWNERLDVHQMIDEKVALVYNRLRRGRRELRTIRRILTILQRHTETYLNLLEKRELDLGDRLLTTIRRATRAMGNYPLAMAFLDAHAFSAIITDIRLTDSFERDRALHSEVNSVVFAARQAYTFYKELDEIASMSIQMYEEGTKRYEQIFHLVTEGAIQ